MAYLNNTLLLNGQQPSSESMAKLNIPHHTTQTLFNMTSKIATIV